MEPFWHLINTHHFFCAIKIDLAQRIPDQNLGIRLFIGGNGIFEVVLPRDNEKDLPDIPENIRNDMKLHFVESMDEVLRIALEKEIDAMPLPAPTPAEMAARRQSEDEVTH